MVLMERTQEQLRRILPGVLTGCSSASSSSCMVRRTAFAGLNLQCQQGANSVASNLFRQQNCCQQRSFSEAAPTMSPEASSALQNIKDTLNAAPRRKVNLSKKQKRELQGNYMKYQRNVDNPEFHNIDLNRNGRIFEPTDKFVVVVTSSKNNLWIAVVNKARENRTVFTSHAGNIGARKAQRRGPETTFRVAQNVARKCKRLGVTVVDEMRFRLLMKVESVLQAFQTHGVKVCRLSHIPRLPKCDPHKPKKRRRL